jgi:ABC-2 type transport system permease protein
MATDRTLTPVPERGWLQGLGNLTRRENQRWWGTRRWITQIVIWALIVNGLLAMILINAVNTPGQSSLDEAVTIFYLFIGLGAGVGVAILGQEALVQERQTGTAAWVLSKPVSRSAFVVSKLVGNALGILVTMVGVQGLLGWLLFRVIAGVALPLGAFIAGLGLAYLVLVFYLMLAIMLGTLFSSRGPVIGICLLLLFGFQIFTSLAPWSFQVMPWALTMNSGSDLSYAARLALGRGLPSPLPVLATAVWCLIFVAVALWRFNREEF